MIAAAALAVLAAASCRNDLDEHTGLNPEITVVGDTVFDAGGGNIALSLTSTASWTAETDQTWCVVSPSGGEAGEHTLYLMSEANDSESGRNASLIIRSGSLEKRMTIVQKSYNQYAGRLTLIHTNSFYKIPLIEGSSFNGGTIDWGDGTREEYVTDLTHEYAGTGPYRVVIDVVAAETFYLPDIVGLEELDLSQF